MIHVLHTITSWMVFHPVQVFLVVSAVYCVVVIAYSQISVSKAHKVTLQVLDVKPDPQRNMPGVVFKSKLRVVLQNEEGQVLYFYRADWVADAVRRHGTWFRFELETAAGRRSSTPWEAEAEAVCVKPGQVFCASIALEPSVGDEDIRQWLATRRRLGILRLFMKVGKGEAEWETDIPLK